jgi:hypothetical protein
MLQHFPHSFKHIHNGMVFDNDIFYPMIEFKIDQTVLENTSDKNIFTLFQRTNCDSAWFIVDLVSRKLDGPVVVSSNNSGGDVIINDKLYLDINGFKIDNISDNIEDLIAEYDIPDWILQSLLKSNYSTK